MPNTRKNVLIGSILRRPENPFEVRLPQTDNGGIFDVATTVLNTPIVLGGSYMKNLSSDGFSGDLRIPVCPVITTIAIADTVTLEIRGIDHLGRGTRENPMVEIVSKTGTTVQTDCAGLTAWSKIFSIIPRAILTPANRLRLGFCYSTRVAVAGVDLGSQLVAAATVGACRRLPLPFIPLTTSDVQVRFLGTDPNASAVISKTPRGVTLDTLVFTTTGATITVASGSWDVSAILVGDVAYTLDGYMGEIVSAAANAIVVDAWWKDGVAGTPGLAGSVLLAANKAPWITVVRNSVQTYSALVVVGGPSKYSLTQGGLEPGARVMPLSVTAPRTNIDVAGVHINSATFGFLPSLNSESAFDTRFEVTVRQGSLY